MKRLVLHTGIPKTGSTTLQEAVFFRHSQVFYLGKQDTSLASRGCRSEALYDLLDPILWHPKPDTDWESVLQRFDTEVLAQASPEQVAVASWEGLGMLKAKAYSGLLARFGRLSPDFRLLQVQRNPEDWLTSRYLQRLRSHYASKKQEAPGFGRPWFSFDSWMESQLERFGSLETWLSQAPKMQAALAQLGRTNLKVMLFESLKADPVAFYRELSEFVGIDADETLALIEGEHSNTRVTEAQYAHIRRVDANPLRRWYWRKSRATKARRLESLQRIDRAAGGTPGQKVELSEEWRQRIAEASRDGNRWLRDELGLDVERYGYVT